MFHSHVRNQVKYHHMQSAKKNGYCYYSQLSPSSLALAICLPGLQSGATSLQVECEQTRT